MYHQCRHTGKGAALGEEVDAAIAALRAAPELSADTTSLRSRCATMLSQLQRNAVLRQGSPVDDLLAFVVAETGRRADSALDGSLPLCLYFATEADREEFIAAVREAKPNMIAKRLP